MKLRPVTRLFLAALVLIGLLGWASSTSQPRPSGSLAVSLAKVTFAGYSNAPDGRGFAWFCVTNPADYKILYFPATVEVRYEGIWRDLPPSGPAKVLAPHASISVNFAKPKGGEAWRVTTLNGLAPPTWKPFVERFAGFVPGLQNWIDGKYPILLGPSSSEPRTD